MLRTLSKLLAAASLAALSVAAAAAQELSTGEAAKMLPERVGSYRATGPAQPAGLAIFGSVGPGEFGVVSHARRAYVSDGGGALSVQLVKTRTDSGAYSLLTSVAFARSPQPSSHIRLNEVGTAGVSGPGGVSFFKGAAFVDVRATGGPADGDAEARDLARLIAEELDAGEGGVPVLALHLPEWEKVQGRVEYAVALPVLKAQAGNEPVLDAVSFEGGAEAATAPYDGGRLVVVEFTTPQYATDSDARVTQRIDELRAAGGSVPTAYRRVGNYAVFVFGAADERAAAALIDQVKYEKDVRWLGRNPHEQAMREKFLTTTMGGVVVTTLKATGAAIILCLGVGALFGGFIFLRRRARAAASEIYTDAGGMLRLDIEDLNSRRVSPGRLIDGGVKK